MGGALGRVVQSKHHGFAVGDLVTNRLGFREYFTSDGKGLTKLTPDPDLPLTVHMHALGGTGFTAYGGLLHIGQLKDGEQVFVSTAAGAVGSVAAQIAKIKGCYVVGSTGSDDKAAWLKDEAGLDAVINYKTEPIRQALEDGDAQGPRRLFRQRRRRPPGGGAAAHEHARAASRSAASSPATTPATRTSRTCRTSSMRG